MSIIKTTNGAHQHDHTGNHALEFFSKVGSIMKDKLLNNNKDIIINLFKNVWYSGNHELAMKLLFWLRDIRKGAGNRSAFRECIKWLSENDSAWLKVNIFQIPEFGRWDDLRTLFNSSVQNEAVELWAEAIRENHVLAAKWADRKDKALLNYLRSETNIKNEADFRKMLANIRKNHIVEHLMCSKEWDKIDFEKIPSKAMSMYSKAFTKNAKNLFELYKSKLEKGEAKINAGTLFPHDCVKTLLNGDTAIANAQFDALPNFLEGKKGTNKIIVLVDTSYSMVTNLINDTTRSIYVSTALGLYCSDRLPKDSPFYRKFIQFESESILTDWKGLKFSEAFGIKENEKRNSFWNRNNPFGIFNAKCGSTNLGGAIDTLLNYAKKYNIPKEQMPDTLLIVSDMQFDQIVEIDKSKSFIESKNIDWEKAGYKQPKIVFWRVYSNGIDGSPGKTNEKDIGLISGFSPSILNSVFEADDFTPIGIMNKTLENYNIISPTNKNY